MSLLVPVKRNSTFAWPAFNDLEHQLDRIFSGNADAATPGTAWTPPVDVRETEDAYLLEADLPGLTREDIDVQVIEDRVTIRGKRQHTVQEEQKGYWRRERVEGTFERSFRLRGGIEGDKVEASFENGVLSVKLPKPEATKPKQIEVKIK